MEWIFGKGREGKEYEGDEVEEEEEKVRIGRS